ncbi:tRNA-dihydrouridine synthase 2 [Coemansia sp. RSA 2610]|nr:tRNA-dihydrouridine synthase 2 [Coemansia sp. RSA 2610]
MWHRLNSIVEELKPLPVVLNGDIVHYEDVERAKKATGATSVMTARGAAANPSIFRAAGELPAIETAVEYVKTAIRMSNAYGNTKYTLMQMYPDTRSTVFRALQGSKCYESMCAAMGLAEFYESEGRLRDRDDPMRGRAGKRPVAATETPTKRVKA